MLKSMTEYTENDGKLYIFGFTFDNLRRLANDEPIFINMKELKTPGYAAAFIACGDEIPSAVGLEIIRQASIAYMEMTPQIFPEPGLDLKVFLITNSVIEEMKTGSIVELNYEFASGHDKQLMFARPDDQGLYDIMDEFISKEHSEVKIDALVDIKR